MNKGDKNGDGDNNGARRYSNSDQSIESLDIFMRDAAEAEAAHREASRAIAELYPETTIMFADVPGFTAVCVFILIFCVRFAEAAAHWLPFFFRFLSCFTVEFHSRTRSCIHAA